MVKPIVAIVGRANVGKSTLFNKICGKRISIVDDVAGVTRDRLYADANWSGKDFLVVDTGGVELKSDDIFQKEIIEQALAAIENATVILFLVDGKTGVTQSDEEVAKLCAEVGYNKEDYLALAQKTKECYEPSSWVRLFEFLANKDENAELAYFYVLLELEMIDEAKERLNSHPQNELLKIRAYLDLKNLGKNYPLELFLQDK